MDSDLSHFHLRRGDAFGSSRSRRPVLQAGQTDEEGRPYPFGGLEPETACMPFDEFATEIEPQPCPRDFRGTGVLSSHEPPENTRLLTGGNADAQVADREEGFAWLTLFAYGQLDRSSLWAVLDGIAEQVGEHLLDAHAVDLHHQRGKRCVQGDDMPLRGHLPLR